jgi:hypothetical protein
MLKEGTRCLDSEVTTPSGDCKFYSMPRSAHHTRIHPPTALPLTENLFTAFSAGVRSLGKGVCGLVSGLDLSESSIRGKTLVAGSFVDPGAENMCIERGGYKDVHMLVQQDFIVRTRGLWSGFWGLV